jgi:hypothetical protein
MICDRFEVFGLFTRFVFCVPVMMDCRLGPRCLLRALAHHQARPRGTARAGQCRRASQGEGGGVRHARGKRRSVSRSDELLRVVCVSWSDCPFVSTSREVVRVTLVLASKLGPAPCFFLCFLTQTCMCRYRALKTVTGQSHAELLPVHPASLFVSLLPAIVCAACLARGSVWSLSTLLLSPCVRSGSNALIGPCPCS